MPWRHPDYEPDFRLGWRDLFVLIGFVVVGLIVWRLLPSPPAVDGHAIAASQAR